MKKKIRTIQRPRGWAPKQQVIDEWNTRKYSWINVKDRLPETCTRVLVSEKHGYQAVAMYIPMKEIFLERENKLNVTHWMELPEPPK